MALHTPRLTSVAPAIPAKKCSTARTPCVILRPSSSAISLSSQLSVVSAKSIISHLAAMPPKKYVYPDPIPDFALAETKKFKGELLQKLSKDEETFADNLQVVVNVCAEIFGKFLHKEYGGPGTLLVEPFTDILVALKEKKLPGATLAARASLLWAQKYVDQDWETWNSNDP